MVEEECRRYKPTKNYLEHLGPSESTTFETELLKHELERIQNRIPMEGLAMKRYELPPPPPGKLSEVGAWTESVKNSMAQLEHQSVRAINLELMMEYGCEAWKSNLEVLTALQAKAQAQLQELRKEIQEVNWQRKSKQMQAGERLRALEAHWVLLVSKNYEIEQTCAGLDEEIYTLQSQMPKEAVQQVTNGNGHMHDEEKGESSSSEEEEKGEERAQENSNQEDEPMEVTTEQDEESKDASEGPPAQEEESNQGNDDSKSPPSASEQITQGNEESPSSSGSSGSD